MTTNQKISKDVQNYYGSVLQTNEDLKTNACYTDDEMPRYIKDIIKDIHDEVVIKFYGCGSPIPQLLEGKTVLDLGCGSGRDAYIFSKLVGPRGKVIGVDMTPEQIDVAKRHQDYHAEKFGFKNTEFILGEISDLESLGIEENSIDVTTSNCVINLCTDKLQVFKQVMRALKPGGELYFSDVFASRRMPAELKNDPTLYGECLSGALYTEDFRRIMNEVGVADFRNFYSRPITINAEDIEQRLEGIRFTSATIRAFKMPLEDRCEDFGQAVIYRGGIPHSENVFILDDHHLFEKGKVYPVCGNTADMLSQSRFSEYFQLIGDKSVHYGLFDCADDVSTNEEHQNAMSCC